MGIKSLTAEVIAWIKFYKSNKLRCKIQPLHLHNCITPFTSQVEALDQPEEKHAVQQHTSWQAKSSSKVMDKATARSKVVGEEMGAEEMHNPTQILPAYQNHAAKNATLFLPCHPGKQKKDSKEWRQSPRSWSKTSSFADAQLEPAKLAWDTTCKSNAGKIGDPFIPTNQRSTKVFALANGHSVPTTTIAKIHHPVHEPDCTLDTVPSLAENFLLSGVKFAEAGYISICDGDEVNIYDDHIAQIVVSEAAVLKGWHCPQSKLWYVPLQAHVTNLNMHTLLLNGPTGCESINSLYTTPLSADMLDHIELFTSNLHHPNP